MTEPLDLVSVIGVTGEPSTVIWHPNGSQVIHALGATVVIRQLTKAGEQQFLRGHDGAVVSLALSPSGRYLASGQLTNMGFPAPICVWDLAEGGQLLHRLMLQKVKIQALHFSEDETRLLSLGGHDDNSIVLWDVATGEAICGSPTHNDFTLCAQFLSHCNDRIVTAGKCNINMWTYDSVTNKLAQHDVETGKLERYFLSLITDSKGQFAFAGTHSGDILQVDTRTRLFRNYGPKGGPLEGGVTALLEAPNGDLLVGGGDGTFGILRVPSDAANPKQLSKMPLVASTKVQGAVMSITGNPEHFGVTAAPTTSGKKPTKCSVIVATRTSAVYHVEIDLARLMITPVMISTAHHADIKAVCFPQNLSDVFATCAFEQIRVWHLASCRELLRIQVPNLICFCLGFSAFGNEILSGWSDGKVRAFGPQSGKLLWTINNAHHKAVTAIAGTPDNELVISGGAEGYCRVWLNTQGVRRSLASLKEHKGAINSIYITRSGAEFITASQDGSCTIWDVKTLRRRTSMFANCFFTKALYHPDESQIVTTATDRRLTFWDAYEGSEIRVLTVSETAAATALDIAESGHMLATGSADHAVKVWGYDEGHCYKSGIGHSNTISDIAISPDEEHIVSVGVDGGIFVWKSSSDLVREAQEAFERELNLGETTSPSP